MTGKEYILLTLALAADFLENLPNKRDAYRIAYSSAAPIKRTNYFMSLSRLLGSKQIEKVIKDGEVFYRITSLGWKGIEEILPIEKLRTRWDGKIRLVVFDIQEKWKSDRERLRALLRSLGFGMLEESVWLTPFAIERGLVSMLSREKIAGEVLVLRSELLSGKIKEIMARAFNLERLEKSYDELIDKWEAKEVVNLGTALRWELEYFEIISSDPCLPDPLLPLNWSGSTAKFIYLKHIRKLIRKEKSN